MRKDGSGSDLLDGMWWIIPSTTISHPHPERSATFTSSKLGSYLYPLYHAIQQLKYFNY